MQMKSITLSQDHKEGSVQYFKGQTVSLPAETVDWLIETGLAERMNRVVFDTQAKPTSLK